MRIWEATTFNTTGAVSPLQEIKTHSVLFIKTALVRAVILLDKQDVKSYIYGYHSGGQEEMLDECFSFEK